MMTRVLLIKIIKLKLYEVLVSKSNSTSKMCPEYSELDPQMNILGHFSVPYVVSGEENVHKLFYHVIPQRKMVTIVTTAMHIASFARNMRNSTIGCNREEKVHDKRRFWDICEAIMRQVRFFSTTTSVYILTKINQ